MSRSTRTTATTTHVTTAASATRAEVSDSQLVADYLRGNTKAFTEIVSRHRGRLSAVARKFARNDHDAEDILQEAWLKAATNMHTYRSEAQLGTWLHRIVANQSYDYNHHRHRRETPILDDDDELRAVPPVVAAPEVDVPTRLDVAAMLNTLPEHQRAALILMDVMGMTATQAAAEVSAQPGTLKSRRSRARRVLQTTFGAYHTSAEPPPA